MKFEIRNRWSGAVQYTCELSAEVADKSYSVQLGFAVKKAIAEKANLSAADLSAANLSAADLSAADLSDANLSAADLSAANLRAANLSAADLSAANLSAADLSDANLSAADLSDANLSAANLRAANLSAADLSDANLSAADLRAANLSAANLSAANLRAANLSAADLSAADLQPIRADFYDVLSWAPAEVPALIAALKEGRVDGSTYTGTCACLVGTIANVRGVDVDTLPQDSYRPIERFFMSIRQGDTPETNQHAAVALGWAETWLASMQAAFAPKSA